MLKAVAAAARYWPACNDGRWSRRPRRERERPYRKLAGGLVTGGERVLVSGMLFDLCVGLAVQLGGKAGKLLLQRGKLLLRSLQCVLGGVIGGLRREVVGDQLLLALKVDRVEVDVLLGLLDLGQQLR